MVSGGKTISQLLYQIYAVQIKRGWLDPHVAFFLMIVLHVNSFQVRRKGELACRQVDAAIDCSIANTNREVLAYSLCVCER